MNRCCKTQTADAIHGASVFSLLVIDRELVQLVNNVPKNVHKIEIMQLQFVLSPQYRQIVLCSIDRIEVGGGATLLVYDQTL